jgi:hypothetical protein
METFFKEIKEKIIEAVKKDFPKIKEEFGNEKPYVVAFETDHDYITLWLGVNTHEYLEKRDAYYAELFAEKDYVEDDNTKWNPSEWGYSDGNGHLAKISVELSDKMGSITDHIMSQEDNLSFDEFSNRIEDSGFPRLFIETVTSAFQELIQANVFGFDSDEITYFISMGDDDRAEEIENNSAKILNSKKVYEEFLKRRIC